MRVVVVLQIMLVIIGAVPARAQATAFTYQGRLAANGSPYTGSAEFQATLWSVSSGGIVLATNTPPTVIVGVTNGLFVLPLDFGANFPGANRWLQLEVRTTIGPFTLLTPRQALSPTPYAMTAGNLSGALPANQLSGVIASSNLAGTYSDVVTFGNAGNSFTGSGSGLSGLNAAALASGTVPDGRLAGNVARTNQVWLLNGNAGTTPGTQFLGTRDAQPLEFKVNGKRALRLEFRTNYYAFGSPSPNVIAGNADNEVAPGVSGATIAGGGGTNWWGSTSLNRVSGEFSTIGGGVGHTVEAPVGTIAGGERGFISSNAYNSFIGGGAWNSIHSGDATIAGGRANLITNGAYSGAIGGGADNTVGADGATVPGGQRNRASGVCSFAAGCNANANHSGSFVWADVSGGTFGSTAPNQFSVRAAGGVRLDGDVQIGGGGGDYQHVRIGGGNSDGFLYGSFPRFGDGIHLGYNYYADAAGAHRVNNAGGGTSRISVGYGYIGLGTGGVNAAPTTDRLVVGTTSVTVTGTFNNNSDRDAKQDIEPVNPAELLNKVIRLPLNEWSYKSDAATRHIGPMAQDFYFAFNVGTDDRHIAPIDEAGVALAAIQGLNAKVESGNQKAELRIQKLETENTELKWKNAEMETRLGVLEKFVSRLTVAKSVE